VVLITVCVILATVRVTVTAFAAVGAAEDAIAVDTGAEEAAAALFGEATGAVVAAAAAAVVVAAAPEASADGVIVTVPTVLESVMVTVMVLSTSDVPEAAAGETAAEETAAGTGAID
jgi:hypothetical protein